MYVYHILFIYSWSEGHWGSSHFLTIVARTATNITKKSTYRIICKSFGNMLSNGIARSCFSFHASPHWLPQWLHQFAISPTVHACQHILSISFLNLFNLTRVRQYFKVVLIWISLNAKFNLLFVLCYWSLNPSPHPY